MKRRVVLFLSVVLIVTGVTLAQESDSLNAREIAAVTPGFELPNPGMQREIKYDRLAVVGGGVVVTLGASYLYVRNVWWANQQTQFHLEPSKENYAMSQDKFSHFFGGTTQADLLAGGLQWSGYDDASSFLLGGAASALVALSVELTDGYAPVHGFSTYDFLCGAAGSFYPFLQHHVPALKSVNFKFSYWNHVPQYFDRTFELSDEIAARSFVDNYGNQTYWIVISLSGIAPTSWKSAIPRWLNIAVGARTGDIYIPFLDDGQFKERQVYIALDVNVGDFLPSEGALWVTLRRIFGHIHFPSPAVRVTPSVAWFGFYM